MTTDLDLTRYDMIKLWRKDGFTLRLYDAGITPDGRSRLAYQFKDGRTVIFEGKDYSPSPMFAIDSLDSVYGLLGFLSLKDGYTDSDYFKDYTPAQLAWRDSDRCEELNWMVSDYEERKN